VSIAARSALAWADHSSRRGGLSATRSPLLFDDGKHFFGTHNPTGFEVGVAFVDPAHEPFCVFESIPKYGLQDLLRCSARIFGKTLKTTQIRLGKTRSV